MKRFSVVLTVLTLGSGVSASAYPQEASSQVATNSKISQTDKEKTASKSQKQKFNAEQSREEPTFSQTTFGVSLLKNVIEDQKGIWTSPTRIRWDDANWLVPLGGLTAGLLVTDRQFSKHLPNDPRTLKKYRNVSNYGTASLIGAAGGLYLWGRFVHEDQRRETGILAGETLLNSFAVTETIKYSAGRSRPFENGGSGRFGRSGTSFPSEHATAAWAVAGVIAHEYPGPLTKVLAYGMASAVSLSRVRAKDHFPSDVLIGSVVGWFVGQHVYRRHHDAELGGSEWKSIGEFFRREGSSSPANRGSPYVPLDSWVYPALERLAALGYIDNAFLGMRPWTRLECGRLLGEAIGQGEGNNVAPSESQQLVDTLEQEFASELEELGGGNNRRLRVESVYTRFTGISGQPLNDGYHFGRTILNDFGRPFAEGVNNVTGFSGWASEGRFVVYVRGEYQHAPSSPALPLASRQFIAVSDTNGVSLPVQPATPNPRVDHFQLLDAYVAMNFENWQLSFGKQSLWWGPSKGGPIMFSDNGVPVNMLRVSRVSPVKLHSILGWMGPIRLEFFMGQLAGHEFIFDDQAGLVGQFGRPLDRQPFIHGEKISFKPTPNFEFSVCETTVFAGGPTPLNWHNLIKSYTGFTVPTGNARDITDPRSGVDFTYRVPWVRKWLTIYGDAFTEDEYSPLGYPRKSAFQGGIYLPRIPGVPKLDLRVEAGSTVPPDFQECNGCFYQNGRFLNSYTNLGNLMGSWVGRASQGEQAWSTYWLTSRDRIQFNYRHRKIDGQFLPRGGTVNDGGVRADIWLNRTTELSGSVQYERWNYPVLDSLRRTNVTTSVQLSFWPRHWALHVQ